MTGSPARTYVDSLFGIAARSSSGSHGSGLRCTTSPRRSGRTRAPTATSSRRTSAQSRADRSAATSGRGRNGNSVASRRAPVERRLRAISSDQRRRSCCRRCGRGCRGALQRDSRCRTVARCTPCGSPRRDSRQRSREVVVHELPLRPVAVQEVDDLAVAEHVEAASALAHRLREVDELLAIAEDVGVESASDVGTELVDVEAPVPDDRRVERSALPLGEQSAQQRPDVVLDAGGLRAPTAAGGRPGTGCRRQSIACSRIVRAASASATGVTQPSSAGYGPWSHAMLRDHSPQRRWPRSCRLRIRSGFHDSAPTRSRFMGWARRMAACRAAAGWPHSGPARQIVPERPLQAYHRRARRRPATTAAMMAPGVHPLPSPTLSPLAPA